MKFFAFVFFMVGCSGPTLSAKRAELEHAEDTFCAGVAIARNLERVTGTLPVTNADAGVPASK